MPVPKRRAGDIEQPFADRAEGICLAKVAAVHWRGCEDDAERHPRPVGSSGASDYRRAVACLSAWGPVRRHIGFPKRGSPVALEGFRAAWTIRPFPGKGVRIAASRCSLPAPFLPGLGASASEKRPRVERLGIKATLERRLDDGPRGMSMQTAILSDAWTVGRVSRWESEGTTLPPRTVISKPFPKGKSQLPWAHSQSRQ